MIPLGILAVAGAGGAAAGAYELISTTILSSTSTSVTFSSIDTTTYKHLQIRMTARGPASNVDYVALRFNGDTSGSSNMARHRFYSDTLGVNSSANTNASNMFGGVIAGTDVTGAFSGSIIDILDYSSTLKNKTVRAFSGIRATNGQSYSQVGIYSGFRDNTAAVTSIEISQNGGGSYQIGSRFSLYGIKG